MLTQRKINWLSLRNPNGKEKFARGKPEHYGRRVPAYVTDQYNREKSMASEPDSYFSFSYS
jgi:hypothetical protein